MKKMHNYSTILIIILCFVLGYFSGYGKGQADVYRKLDDDFSLRQIYSEKVE